jgi:hypothetical protein
MPTDRTLILTYRTEGSQEDEREEFNPDRLLDPTSSVRARHPAARVVVGTPEEAEAWGRAILRRFNGSRSGGDLVRLFVSAELQAT